MERLAAFPVHADHYQFDICDSTSESCFGLPTADRPVPGVLGSVESGYVTDGSTTVIRTCADLNWHWMELFCSDAAPEFDAAERVMVLLMNIQSGEAIIANMCGVYGSVSLAPGIYTVYILGFSLGHDDMSEIPNPDDWPKERSNAELAALAVYEHYHIVFVSGDITGGKIGTVHGKEDFWAS